MIVAFRFFSFKNSLNHLNQKQYYILIHIVGIARTLNYLFAYMRGSQNVIRGHSNRISCCLQLVSMKMCKSRTCSYVAKKMLDHKTSGCFIDKRGNAMSCIYEIKVYEQHAVIHRSMTPTFHNLYRLSCGAAFDGKFIKAGTNADDYCRKSLVRTQNHWIRISFEVRIEMQLYEQLKILSFVKNEPLLEFEKTSGSKPTLYVIHFVSFLFLLPLIASASKAISRSTVAYENIFLVSKL